MSWMVIALVCGGVLSARANTDIRAWAASGHPRWPRRPPQAAAQNIPLGSGSKFTHPNHKGAPHGGTVRVLSQRCRLRTVRLDDSSGRPGIGRYLESFVYAKL